MPACPGFVLTERRGHRASRLRLLAGMGWLCLAVAVTPGASAHRPASGSHAPRPSGHAAPQPRPGEVTAPVLVGPANHATVAANGPVTRVKLSWRVAPQQHGQPNFVELVTRDSNGTHEVTAVYVHGTYMVVTLPSLSARYFWRVYATEDSGHYALSDWGGFTIASRSAQQ